MASTLWRPACQWSYCSCSRPVQVSKTLRELDSKLPWRTTGSRALLSREGLRNRFRRNSVPAIKCDTIFIPAHQQHGRVGPTYKPEHLFADPDVGRHFSVASGDGGLEHLFHRHSQAINIHYVADTQSGGTFRREWFERLERNEQHEVHVA